MAIKRVEGLVSVVVTCYNIADYVKACLDSLIKQKYQQLEIIIVNDASTDKTAEVVRSWIASKAASSRNIDVQFVSLPRNVGYAGAVTVGQFLARGEFIAMQDGDDFSHSQRFLKQVQFLKENPNIGMVGTSYITFQSADFKKQFKAKWIRYGNAIKRVYAKGGHCVCHGTLLFRGTLFDQFGGHTRNRAGAEDAEFVAKFVKSNIGVENIPENLYFYRSHPKQRSRKYYKKSY